MEFSNLNFNSKILQAIEELGYKQPTPIQLEAIPKVLEGLDLIASAQTGTGKTAAFIIPTLHKIIDSAKPYKATPKALVLVPTRELAMQVAIETKKFSKHLPKIKTVCIFGGEPIRFQEKLMQGCFEILIATPGRLLDFMERGRINLSEIETLILDEADRMLDMGFIDAVKDIAKATPEQKQTLLFSATFEPTILNLSKDLQKDPYRIEVKKDPLKINNIEQHIYYTDDLSHKKKILNHLITDLNGESVIIFSSTKAFADELSCDLKELGLKAQALHGDMNQRQRTRALELLKSSKANILVATDVAARGIDVSKLSYVINFDLPMQIEDYVHRIGRTGRAGEKGVAISFVTPKERYLVRKIEEKFNLTLEAKVVEGLEPKKAPPSDGSDGMNKNFRFKSNGQSRNRRGSSFGSRGSSFGNRTSSYSRDSSYGRGSSGRDSSYSRDSAGKDSSYNRESSGRDSSYNRESSGRDSSYNRESSGRDSSYNRESSGRDFSYNRESSGRDSSYNKGFSKQGKPKFRPAKSGSKFKPQVA